jgi:hypothetical protein
MKTVYQSTKDYNSETLMAIVMYTFLLYLYSPEAGTHLVIGQSYIQGVLKISKVNFVLKHIKSTEPANI